MTPQDRQTQDYYATHAKLWKLKTQELNSFADTLRDLSQEEFTIGFDRYTWAELSSGQMPAQLMPSHCADFITITKQNSPFLDTIKDFAELSNSIELSTSSKSQLLSPENICESEADFDGSNYLIIDQNKNLHLGAEPYEFDGQIEACFFVPSPQLLSDLYLRVRDKEKLKIETGPSLRC
jgi:hypothetical protein